MLIRVRDVLSVVDISRDVTREEVFGTYRLLPSLLVFGAGVNLWVAVIGRPAVSSRASIQILRWYERR